MRRFRFLHKTNNSPNGACPAVYAVDEVDGGGYVVQGKFLSPGEMGQLRDLSDDETAVWVDADVIDRLARG